MANLRKENTKVTQGGVGFFGLLTLLFIGLKLCNIITWSWIWVLSPLWLPSVLLIVIGLGILIFIGLISIIAYIVDLFIKK